MDGRTSHKAEFRKFQRGYLATSSEVPSSLYFSVFQEGDCRAPLIYACVEDKEDKDSGEIC
jgi:hypothetical protein